MKLAGNFNGGTVSSTCATKELLTLFSFSFRIINSFLVRKIRILAFQSSMAWKINLASRVKKCYRQQYHRDLKVSVSATYVVVNIFENLGAGTDIMCNARPQNPAFHTTSLKIIPRLLRQDTCNVISAWGPLIHTNHNTYIIQELFHLMRRASYSYPGEKMVNRFSSTGIRLS